MTQPHEDTPPRARRGGPGALVRLARIPQWSKSLFVVIGPFYAYAMMRQAPGFIGDGRMPPAIGTGDLELSQIVLRTLLGAIGFALVSSGLYVLNDIADVEADRAHPRKCRRPIASGEVSPGAGKVFAAVLMLGGFGAVALLPGQSRWWVMGLLAAHLINVSLYTAVLKHRRIVDVMSLSLGFVLRVVAGCAAVAIVPSTWLLNATFFLSMFLAFGKRLGERQSMGKEAASETRQVLERYSRDMLRMLVVVTAVATLLTYAQYVQDRGDTFLRTLFSSEHTSGFGFNMLWLTMIPATFALLRAMVMVESGRYDDPTELATKDPPFMAAAAAFVLLTVVIAF